MISRRVASSWALVALLAASGCGGAGQAQTASTRRLDGPGTQACNTFARWLAGPERPDERQDIAVKVDKLAADSKSGELSAKSETLASSTVVNSDQDWKLAADAFAYECQQLGWTAADAQ